MSVLSINANKEDWNESVLTFCGVKKEGRDLKASKTQIVAKNLIPEHLAIWEAAVEQFRGVGRGDWDASSVTITKNMPSEALEEGEEPTVAFLNCNVLAEYPDETSASLNIKIEEKAMVDFFDYYFDWQAWETPVTGEISEAE